MKLHIDKTDFMKSWQLAERVTSTKSTISTLSGILCHADEGSSDVLLNATDLKTSIKCGVSGVTVEEPGTAVFPLKMVGELFKKIPTREFTVQVKEGRGTLVSGRNRYSFTTYATDEFPRLPSSENADTFCISTAGELLRILDEGTIAGNAGEEFPKYLGAAMIEAKDGEIRAVSTDGRRLSLSKAIISKDVVDKDMLLPLQGLRELQRILGTLDEEVPVEVLADEALAYFRITGLEFSVRRIESSFPNYEKILSPLTTTTIQIDRSAFISALERVDVVVRDYSRMVVLTLSPGGDLTLSGRAPEIGQASEFLEATIKGESLRIAFNVGYLLDGLKALHGDDAYLTFNGSEGQMMMLRPNETNFLYMLMPIKLKESDMEYGEEEAGTEKPES